MANRNILLAEVPLSPTHGHPDMDESSFRKLAAERLRPRTAGAVLFHAGTGAATAPTANLPALRHEPLPPTPAALWDSLCRVGLDAAWLTGNGLFPKSSTEPAAAAFDILRTRILLAFQQQGWRRIAVTSPTHGCGKSIVAANLALSLSRREDSRTVLMDLELRRPGLADLLGLRETAPLRDALTGRKSWDDHILRVGRTLGLALNCTPDDAAAELLQSPETAATLATMIEALAPEAVIYDLPPVLVSDDVIGFLPQVDAVLLVADATQTTAEEVRACERLFEGRVPLLGVVLNRAQDLRLSRYRYGRKRR